LLTVELGRLAKLRSLESQADELLEDIRILRLTARGSAPRRRSIPLT
jgi:hypothetical protein